jgi:hypothetical protein
MKCHSPLRMCLEMERMKRKEYAFWTRINKGIFQCKSGALQLSKPGRSPCLIIPEFNVSHQVQRLTLITLLRKLVYAKEQANIQSAGCDGTALRPRRRQSSTTSLQELQISSK